MCELCDEAVKRSLETEDIIWPGCQFCSVMVCYDIEGDGDDLFRRACSTSGGALACVYCAREIQEEEDRQSAENMGFAGYNQAPKWTGMH